jgi:PTH1 family peptidyl-tRNA hydrolase
MNLSGLGIQSIKRERGCDPGDLVVVYDDMDLTLGQIKFKQRGGDGGHKGIRSIIETLGVDRFLRLRIGIGHPPRAVEASDYLLTSFSDEEREVMDRTLERASDALRAMILEGLQEAMNRFHAPATPSPQSN